MPRMPQPRRFAKAALFLSALLIVAGLLVPNLGGSAGAQSSLSAEGILPGDTGSFPAAARQDQPQISRGSDNFLAVWTDARSALRPGVSFNDPFDGAGLGTLLDIYAARIDAAGQVVDATPIVVNQGSYSQGYARVGWNGQNWLVAWLTVRENDRFRYDLKAARVSPSGQVLDPTPILLKADVHFGEWPSAVIDDGAGNWLVMWDTVLPQEGTSIPRGVAVARVAGDGSVLDPGGRVIYNHHSQYLANPDLARAGDRYLLTFIAMGPPYRVMGLTLDANFTQLLDEPRQLAGNGFAPRVASNGTDWLVTWGDGASGNVQSVYALRVLREGLPVGPAIVVRDNVGISQPQTHAAWDGSNWFVAYNTTFNGAYFPGDDIYLTRVSGAGIVLDPAGIPVKVAEHTQLYPSVAPAPGGGAQLVWADVTFLQDVQTARVSAAGAVANNTTAALGAARQSEVRLASNGSGFLAVFRSETSERSRIMGQHLDASGAPVEQEPFVIADGATNDNPSVAWNGSTYLAVWDTAKAAGGRETHGRVVPASGAPSAPSFLIMDGETPDAAGHEGSFFVVNILPGHQVRRVQTLALDGAGSPAGAPAVLIFGFNQVPRVANLGGHWLVVAQGRNNHDGGTYNTRGAFVSPAGHANPLPSTVFTLSTGGGFAPHLAVAGDSALVVWSSGGTGGGDIHGRRVFSNGTLDGAANAITTAPDAQLNPTVTWDGSQFVVVWFDGRGEAYPLHPRGNLFGARVAPTGIPLEEFAVANSPAPEDTPFVSAASGLTVFAYAKFYSAAPFAAHRVTLRTARFAATEPGVAPTSPRDLVATQTNEGVGTVTLRWEDASDNETGFRVEMRSGTGAFSHIRTLPANTTSTGGITVGANDESFFRVRAYNAAGDSGYTNEASPPVVKITTPLVGQMYTAPASIQIDASATDAGGVARVEFYAKRDGEQIATLLGTDTAAPYGVTWSGVGSGAYHLTAKGFDAQGNSTVSNSVGIGVTAPPSATIISPPDGSVYTQPEPVTLTATASTNNDRSGYHIDRLDFYNGKVWIGQGVANVWQGPWSFTWASAPAGTHSVTAHATLNSGQVGVSAPVQITVRPQTQPTPDTNQRPSVTLTAPANNTSLAAGASFTASATASDADGTVARVEFRANGFTVATDTSAPYSASLSLPGGEHNVTAVAFDDKGASTISTAARVTVARSEGSPLVSTVDDGQSVLGPSVVSEAGPPVNKELADDFDLVADIDRVVVYGGRGWNPPEYPIIKGAFVRFYAWENGAPGALQDETFVQSGSPNFVYDARNPATIDVRLPHSFRATGKHFFSVQLLIEGWSGYWYWASARTNQPAGASVRVRDHYAGGAWGPYADVVGVKNCDAVFAIYGSLTGTGRIDSVTPTTVERSGYFIVRGANFGEARGELRVDNLPSVVIKWANTEIVAYVPEGSRLGSVPVVVANAGGTSNAVNLNVTARRTDGRIRWRATVADDYILHRAAIAPAGSPAAGTVYANTARGLTYAWSPDGALKWVVQTGKMGGYGPVSVGADGTIYVASLLPTGVQTFHGGAVIALNPDGTQKWQFIDPESNSVRAGPSVGPDGKIYVIFNPGVNPQTQQRTGFNLAALRPDGTLAWFRNRAFNQYGSMGKELTFGRTLPHVYFAFESDFSFPNGGGSGTFAYDFDGQLVWSKPGGCCGVPAVAPDGGLRHFNSRLDPRTGETVYTFPLFGQGPQGAPDAGPDNTHYFVQNSYRLFAVRPDGTEKWHYDEQGMLFNPVISPTNNTVFSGGRVTFGQPGFLVGVDPANGQQLWKMLLPDEPGFGDYGQVVPMNRPLFAPDGNTAYVSADVAGDGDPRTGANPYSFFYAVNTSRDDVPVNQQPVVQITSPLDSANFPKNAQINITATATDDQPVAGVDFYIQHGFQSPRQFLSTDTSAPYTASFTATESNGYGIIAEVRDAGGLVGTSRVTIQTTNERPRVAWVSPTHGATLDPPPASVALTASASDTDGSVTKVQFYNASGLVGEDTTPDSSGNYTVAWANPPVGVHTLRASSFDDENYRADAFIDIRVGPAPTPTPTPTPTPYVGEPPAVRITSPADGTMFAPGTSVTVTAEAQDPDGTIARVEFWEVRQPPASSPFGTDTTAPYTANIISASTAVREVYAKAFDNSGNAVNSASIFIIWDDPRGDLSISGRIRHQQSTPGNEIFVPGVLVELRLHNALVRAVRTDSSGSFSFDRLTSGGEYGVKPVEPRYSFYPPAVIWSGLSEDETFDFVAEGPLPPGPTPSPTPGANVLAWEKFYNGPTNGSDADTRVTVDAAGNTYVTGVSYVTNGGGDTDISTVKYAPDGTQLWSKTFAGLGGYKDWPVDVQVDGSGNVYVAGTAWRGSAFWYDLVTIKYDSTGNELWVRYLNGPAGSTDMANAMALDSAGNVLVTGYVRAARDEFATVKYAPDGTELWVARRSQAQIGDHAIDVVTDAQNNVYVTGFAWTSSGGNEAKDIVTVKYSPAGAELWAARFNGPEGTQGPQPLPSNPVFDEPGGIALDPSGQSVYVFGTNEAGATATDFLLLKYGGSTGALAWGRNWTGPSYDYAKDMAVDSSGNIFVTGETYDAAFEEASNSYQTSDAATVKFDAAGNLLWARVYRAFPGKWDGNSRVALAPSGGAYVGLYSEGFVNTDTAIVKYGADGTEQWVYRYDNPQHTSDIIGDMASDGAGNLYVAGQGHVLNSAGQVTLDFITLKLAATASGLNSPPDVVLEINGPTIAGGPVANSGSIDDFTTNGPTIAGRSVRIKARATDRDGRVARVDFFVGQQLVGSDTSDPYELEWTAPKAGTYAVTALAVDDAGGVRSSETQSVTVTDEGPGPTPTPAPQTYAIRGQVSVDGSPRGGVEVALSGAPAGAPAATTTNADGRYSFMNLPAGGTYTVAPAPLAGYAFTPSSKSFGSMAYDCTADFDALSAPRTRTNVALASNGGRATASSTHSAAYTVSSVNNGDRKGLNWGAGGGWNDATANAYPDWVGVAFDGEKNVSEVSVFTLQDNLASPAEPTEGLTFTKYGVTGMQVEFWTGTAWQIVPGGMVVSTDKVWNKFSFAPVRTTKVRVVVNNALFGHSRLVEVEAWQEGEAAATTQRTNVALAANGGTVAASSAHSSAYPAGAINNGDRKGTNWGAGGGWNDATANTYPDWVEVTFAGAKTIDEVSVFTLQDNLSALAEPSEAMTFTKYGVTDFEVQYWNAAAGAWTPVTGGMVNGNNLVWRKVTFAPVSTTKIRVVVHGALFGHSRITEVEAWEVASTGGGGTPARVNHALASSGGAVASSSDYSSAYPVSSVNNGDRKGLNWGAGGGWNDATANAYPDWIEVSFNGAKSLTEVHVFTLQDNIASPAEPSEALTFTKYGVTDFDVEYWNGTAWVVVPGGMVVSNNLVWRKLTFAPVSTTKIRVVFKGALFGHSRVTEIEAY